MAEQDYISEDQKVGIEKHSSNTNKVNAFVELLTASSEEIFLKFLFSLYQTDQAETAEFLCSLHMYPTRVENEIRTMQEEGDMDLITEVGDNEEHLFQTEEGPFNHHRQSGRKASEYVRSLPVPQREEDLETVSSFALTEISKDSGYLSGQTPIAPKARVMEHYQAQDDTELTLEVGDIITIMEQNEDGMWTGTLGAETGLFPSRCVKMIDLNAKSQVEREADETALKLEVQALISKQRDEKQNLDKLEERILDLSKTLNSLEVSTGHTEEQIHTFFHINRRMNVVKKDPSRSGTPAVSAARWQTLRDTVLPQHVKAVVLNTVRLGACTESVFSYVEQCHNLNQLGMNRILTMDNTEKKSLAKGLASACKNLHELVQLDIRWTPLGGGWGSVLSSLSSPHLRLLTLYDNELAGCGQQLADCLSGLPVLAWLGLNNSGLTGEELVAVLGSLPTSCLHLVALLVAGHTLPDQGAALTQAVKHLPKLKLLVSQDISLPAASQVDIIQNVSSTIELVAFNGNNPLSNKEDSLYNQIEQHPSLRYVRMSPDQVSPEGQKPLSALLQARGGRLVVGGSKDPGWQQYRKYINQVATECRTKL